MSPSILIIYRVEPPSARVFLGAAVVILLSNVTHTNFIMKLKKTVSDPQQYIWTLPCAPRVPAPCRTIRPSQYLFGTKVRTSTLSHCCYPVLLLDLQKGVPVARRSKLTTGGVSMSILPPPSRFYAIRFITYIFKLEVSIWRA